MSRASSHETITLFRRPASPGICVPFAGVSSIRLARGSSESQSKCSSPEPYSPVVGVQPAYLVSGHPCTTIRTSGCSPCTGSALPGTAYHIPVSETKQSLNPCIALSLTLASATPFAGFFFIHPVRGSTEDQTEISSPESSAPVAGVSSAYLDRELPASIRMAGRSICTGCGLPGTAYHMTASDIGQTPNPCVSLSTASSEAALGAPFCGESYNDPYQAHFLYHPATLRRPGRVRGTRNCVNLRHRLCVSAPVFSDCNRADMPGQPIFRSLLFKRDWSLRRAIRCGGGSGLRTDRTPSARHCGICSHNSFKFGVKSCFPTSGGVAATCPAAGLWPSHPLISIPAASYVAAERIVVRHNMDFFRTPERCLCTVPGSGFEPPRI